MNPRKNRNPQAVPFDHNKVVLAPAGGDGGFDGEPESGDYINASFVDNFRFFLLLLLEEKKGFLL
jgi:protein tyrosine phosphatase